MPMLACSISNMMPNKITKITECCILIVKKKHGVTSSDATIQGVTIRHNVSDKKIYIVSKICTLNHQRIYFWTKRDKSIH